jgi:virulence-associated protein VagC
MKVVNQSQKVSNKSSMDIFLTPTPSQTPTSQPKETQLNAEKMKVSNQGKENSLNPSSRPTEEKAESKQMPKVESKPKEEKITEKLEEMLQQIEEKVRNSKEIGFSDFNKVVFEKSLKFKLLFIRQNIYVMVANQDNSKMATIKIRSPKWGGASLRYLINNCVSDWCVVKEKVTQKGKVLTYVPLSTRDDDDNIEDIEDIFD